jgi:hypothetical protein
MGQSISKQRHHVSIPVHVVVIIMRNSSWASVIFRYTLCNNRTSHSIFMNLVLPNIDGY